MLFDLAEFVATGLVTRTLDVQAEGRGEIEITITSGNTVAITHEGTMLPVNFLGQNPYARDGKLVFLDIQGKVWLGFEVPA